MQLEGLNTTEWWFLRTQIETVSINTEGHRMEGDVYIIAISNRAGEHYELYMDTTTGGDHGIMDPLRVVKL